ncbi:SH3 domain-containing protein [Streptomyces sp. NPDC050804]|uniref:SH3 domain-containing protein n=1 Tax=Streptomyces sp. NPDC050804 TaxID=3154745 RepID=UPI0034365988
MSAGSTKSVGTNGLRLRSQPGYSGYVKGLLYRGDRLFIRETFGAASNPWVGVVLKVRSKGGLPKLTRGYVHKSYLR